MSFNTTPKMRRPWTSHLIKALGLGVAVTAVSAGAAFAAVAIDSVNVRSGPGTSYKVLDTLRAGEVVAIANRNAGWCEITSPGPEGWVSCAYLSGTTDNYYDDDDYYDDDYGDDAYFYDSPYHHGLHMLGHLHGHIGGIGGHVGGGHVGGGHIGGGGGHIGGGGGGHIGGGGGGHIGGGGGGHIGGGGGGGHAGGGGGGGHGGGGGGGHK